MNPSVQIPSFGRLTSAQTIRMESLDTFYLRKNRHEFFQGVFDGYRQANSGVNIVNLVGALQDENKKPIPMTGTVAALEIQLLKSVRDIYNDALNKPVEAPLEAEPSGKVSLGILKKILEIAAGVKEDAGYLLLHKLMQYSTAVMAQVTMLFIEKTPDYTPSEKLFGGLEQIAKGNMSA